MELKEVLKGLRVVELASVLAGPLAGSFLAELGAEVLKIENGPAGGDVTRTWKLEGEVGINNASAYYHSANFGKKVLMCDLKSETDKASIYSYIKDCDIVITNYQKATAEKLGISINAIRKLNNDAIIVQLNAFEYDDPRPGYDLVMQAESGFISMCGEKDHLAKMPVAMIDVIAAHQIKEVVLLGLLQKKMTGEANVFHVSLYKSALSALVNQGTNYLMENHVAQPMGTLHPNIAPYGEVVVTADKIPIMLAIGSDGQFDKLAKILQWSEAALEFYATNQLRIQRRKELQSELLDSVKTFASYNLIDLLERENVPFAIVKNMKDVLSDPQSSSMVLNNPIAGRNDGKYISNVAFSIARLEANESH